MVKIAELKFKWKKTTTYTVLKRLCNKKIFKNSVGLVTSCISKEEYNYIDTTKDLNAAMAKIARDNVVFDKST